MKLSLNPQEKHGFKIYRIKGSLSALEGVRGEARWAAGYPDTDVTAPASGNQEAFQWLHFLTMWPWASYLLHLLKSTFLIHKRVKIIVYQ